MKRLRVQSITGAPVILTIVMSCLVAMPSLAQTNQADAVMDAYNKAFLVQSYGHTWYTWGYQQNNLADRQWGWGQDLVLYPLEDRYEYTHSSGDQALVNSELDSMLTSNSWAGDNAYNVGMSGSGADGWNVDIGWSVAAYARGYLLTGNPTFLTEAAAGWNFVINGRPGDTAKPGLGLDPVNGGITETDTGINKCQVANSNFVYGGVWLYKATGDIKYLNGAEAIYAWERIHFANLTGKTVSVPNLGNWVSGQVIACTLGLTDPQPQTTSDNVYDAGGVLYAAAELYEITGNQQYYNDAMIIINHIYSEYHPSANPPQPISTGNGNSSNIEDGGYMPQIYAFTRALSNFLTYTGGWNTEYGSWLKANAQDAWNDRNSVNLTWNDWSKPITEVSLARSMDTSSAAGIWQQLPPPALNLAGTYEIQNVGSSLVLNVQADSTAEKAAIIQYPFFNGQTNSLWTFVPTSGGYYQIKNVNSGLVVNVMNQSGINGAPIIQWPAQAIIPGNDQWMPVQNSDGTYSFYNLLSKQALDVPGGSTASGTQLDQSFGNGTNAQKFKLIAH